MTARPILTRRSDPSGPTDPRWRVARVDTAGERIPRPLSSSELMET